MESIKKYKIGMRTIKTGISVGLSLYIARMLKLNSPSLVGIAAIVSMQSTVSESFTTGKNRMMGTFIGAFLGLILSYVLPTNYFFLSLGIILVIYIHNIFNWKQSLSLSTIVFMAIFLNKEGARLFYAVNRLLDTFIGIIVSMFVNYFIATPDSKSSFAYLKSNIYEVLKNLIYGIVTNLKDSTHHMYIDELNSYNRSFLALKNDLLTNSQLGRSSKLALDIVNVLENIESHLAVILELNIIPILNEENELLFKNLYGEDYISSDREVTNLDNIYNYHISKIFNKLLKIEDYFQIKNRS